MVDRLEQVWPFLRRLLRQLALLVLIVAACTANGTDPASTLDAYVAAYNTADVDAVMEVFSEESQIFDHPFGDTVSGLDEIRRVHIDEFEFSADQDAYTFSNVEVSGSAVIWDHVWVNAGGDRYCIEGNTAVVEEGKILTWTWPNDGIAEPC